MEASEKIVNALKQKGEALRPGEIAELAGIDKKDTEKAIKKLVEQGQLYSPKRCFYDIKK